MTHRRPLTVLVALWTCLAVVWSVAPRPCGAHKLMIYASAAGETISGSVYLDSGARLKDLTVRVQGPDGQKLGQVSTNEEGEFSYRADMRCDHVFVAHTPAGHRATYTVEASELPVSLPRPEGSQGGAAAEQRNAAESGEPDSSVPEAGKAQLSREEIRSIVEEAVSRQLRPLRRDMQKRRSEVQIRDVLGGVGYIFGLMGIILYLKKLRRDRRS